MLSTTSGAFRLVLAGMATLAALFSYSLTASAATVVTVSGDTAAGENQPGWLFNRDLTTATPYEFNDDAASIGSGSLYVLPIGANASDKFVGENFLNALIADVDSVSYDFKIGAGGDSSDEEQFYMSVYANFGVSPDDKFYDCRYSVVPTTGSTGSFTTVTFDPSAEYPVATRGTSPFACPASPSDMDDLSAGSNIRAFSLNVGDTSTSDIGLDGYLDNVVVNLDSGTTVYDFEPVPAQATTKNDCMKGGFAAFGFKNQGQCIRFVETGKDSR